MNHNKTSKCILKQSFYLYFVSNNIKDGIKYTIYHEREHISDYVQLGLFVAYHHITLSSIAIISQFAFCSRSFEF